MWLYGSGFPKSMALDKALKGKLTTGNANKNNFHNLNGEQVDKHHYGFTTKNKEIGIRTKDYTTEGKSTRYLKKLEPTTELAKKYKGWGTCLKPAYEPIIVARKPFKGTLVDNIIENGVGGINIDDCRIGNEKIKTNGGDKFPNLYGKYNTAKENTHNGRFPANVILTYDQITFDEVCGGMPNTKSGIAIRENSSGKTFGSGTKRPPMQNLGYNDKGSACRYFKNCQYTGKDDDLWKNLYVNNVEENLEIIQAIKDNIAQINVEDLLNELKNHYAKYVENQLDLLETPIVQDIAEILTWDFKIGTSQVIQDFIINSEKCTQFQNLVQFVENLDSIDTTQTTQNLLKLFGYVKAVIINYIQGNLKYDQKRYIYKPKATKKDRDEGLEAFEEQQTTDGNIRSNSETARIFGANSALRRNTHPTVKPTSLMQYLIRLVTPPGGGNLRPVHG